MHQQKRYEYNISPVAQDDLPSFSTKYGSMFKKNQQKPSSPLKGRSQLNASFENRYKQTLQERSNYRNAGDIRSEVPRDRTSSMTGYRAKQDINQCTKDEKMNTALINFSTNEGKFRPNVNQNKEIKNSKYSRNKIQAQFQTTSGSDIKKSRHLQENLNFTNIKLDFPDKSQKMGAEPLVKEINEKELLQKISRINYLNEEINNRLQRMLSKISEYE